MESDSPIPRPLKVYEFFAGGGMVRAGLGEGWRCLFANDIDPAKADTYRLNFPGSALVLGDVNGLRSRDLPGRADLMWGSFPCQDLSLAGPGAGLDGARSGAFHGFWRVLEALDAEGRAPPLVALENVAGVLSASGGRDFAAICAGYAALGYRIGALTIDGALFTPQSRPRLFFVGWRGAIPRRLEGDGPSTPFHSTALARAAADLPDRVRRAWVWWRPPPPEPRRDDLRDVLEPLEDRAWMEEGTTRRILALATPLHRARIGTAGASGRLEVGAACRRTRPDGAGGRIQRLEVRFDGLAGCLRTPGGGSSRQFLVAVEGERVRLRLPTPRETARLMGLPDSYRLPAGATAAYHLTGDGVVVPVVGHLAHHLFEPLLQPERSARLAA